MNDLHDAASPKTMSFKDLLGFLARGSGVALLLALVAGGSAYLLTSRERPVYQATASLLAAPHASNFGSSNVVAPSPVDPSVYQSALLEGPVVASALATVEGKQPSEAAVRSLRDHMVVSINQKDLSSVITIEIRANDPTFAANVANQIATSLVAWDRARAQRNLQQSIDAIQRSIQTINHELQNPATSQDSLPTLRSLLQRRTGELKAAQSTADSAVFVGLLEPLAVATKPNRAVGPRTMLKTFVAAAFGVALAYLLLFLRWSLDTRLGGADDVAALGAGPLLAVFARRRRGAHRLSGEAANFMRANVLVAAGRELPLAIGVTSPHSDREKSGVALSLAESFARSGYATLLIDADLRRSGATVGLEADPKLSPPLEVHLENPGQRLPTLRVDIGGKRGFDFIPSFTPATYPAELLSASFGARLEGWRGEYDVVVVDAPPLLPYADAVILAPYCDGVVACASQRDTTREQLGEALEMLRQAEVRLLGTVLTGAARTPRQAAGRASPLERQSVDPYKTQVQEGSRSRVGTRR